MASPYTVNFKKVRRNVDFYKIITFSINADGDPLDIGGATFKMMVKPKIGTDPDPILTLTMGSGLSVTTDGTDGKLTILVDHTVMVTKDLGNYKYDLVMIRDGASEVVMEGSFKIVEGVTEL